MDRISSQMTNNDVQFNLRRQESKVSNANNQMGSQQRIQRLRDDPIAAGHLVRYQSYNTRLDSFGKNAQTITEQYSVMEGYVNQSLQIMHRINEIGVAGANGTFSRDDLANMATEVDELLQELVLSANAQGPDGVSLFSGTRTTAQSFKPIMGNTEGMASPAITSVQYNGTITQNDIEIDENKYMQMNRAGNELFWAEQQQLFSSVNAETYQATADSEINVNGVDIKINAGDNVYAVIAKINDSGSPVKANLDPVTQGINLTTTDARQLWLEDTTGSVLSDLGVLTSNDSLAPNNINPNARVTGGSMFDTVIALRDALLAGDTESIGGKVMGGLDSSVNNMADKLAQIGSEYERAQIAIARVDTQQLNVTEMISREGDLNITEAITNMKMLEFVQQATLSTAGKMYENSLLNYMR